MPEVRPYCLKPNWGWDQCVYPSDPCVPLIPATSCTERSLERGRMGWQKNSGWGSGVLGLADRLVSWGKDGAIRLWDRDGHSQPGGDAEAHAGEVSGVLALADRLVSWGGDGAIRLWDRDGHSQPGGDAEAHAGEVSGDAGARRPAGELGLGRRDPPSGTGTAIPSPAATPTPTRAGSWGCWGSGDRLVSWGWDGAIRFRDRDGICSRGGDAHAHADWVSGALGLGDRLVSWSGGETARSASGTGTAIASRAATPMPTRAGSRGCWRSQTGW